MESYIPVLSSVEKRGLIDYFNVYIEHADAFSEYAVEELKNHPAFGDIIKNTPKDIREENNKMSLYLQKDAVFNNNWKPFIEYQIQQGIIYAKMGLDFGSWYEIVTMVKNYIRPLLHQKYKDDETLFSSLTGMNLFMDIAMSIIGEAYIQEKNEIINEEKRKIEQLNKKLEDKVVERTAQLEASNKELEAFSYSVSHDLRAPLRAINGYAEILNEDYGAVLDEEGKRILETVRYNATKMGALIDDLLAFSRLGRKELNINNVNTLDLVEAVIRELNTLFPNQANIIIGKLHSITADYGLLNQVFFNLISNAIKYSSKQEKPVVEIGSKEEKNKIIFFVKDNGAGFDMKYSNKLFGVFQRLHSQEEFEGTGVGLAIVHRIISKHKGKVWAEGKVNKGATFYFSINKKS